MKIVAEFNSNEELLSFISTFGAKTVSQITKGVGSQEVEAVKKEKVENKVADDVELTKPVQLHSPDGPPIAPPTPPQQVTPVQTPQIQQPIVPQQPVTPPQQAYAQQPIQQQVPQPVPQPVPQQAAPPVAPVQTATQSYTMEQLAVAATQIVDAGHRNELVSLLASFGVQALTALPKEQYGAFATQLRGLGAKI